MNKLFLLLVLFFATNEIFVVSQKTENFESKTAHLMEQVLAAVSTKSKSSEDDSTMFNLCSMINEIGQQVVEMSQQELSDYGNVLYSLQQEQSEALKNLTLIKGQYNRTVNDLNRHNINLKPIPSQLLDAKSREQELLSRRNSLSQSCNKDILQQQTRLNGVKSDVYALDQVLGHIEKLRNIVSSSSSSVGLSMLEIESEQKTQRKCRIPELHGQVYRCQNAVALQIKSQNGTLSSMPPGNGMNYHKNLHCAFRISPEGSGFFDRVELTFIGIDTAEGVDFVKVYDGPIASESNLLGSFSGGVTPNSIQTRKSNEMTIVFSKNPEYSEQSFGFAAAFQTIKIAPVTPSNAINSCSKNVLEKRQNGDLSINNNVPPFSISGKNGFISEDFRSEFAAVLQPHNVVIEDEYLNSLSCKWLIQVQGNETVRVHFTFFDTKENQDFIEIYDGDSTSSKLLLTNSSGLTYTPSDVFSTTNNVLITFRTSNFLREGGGFHLSWCVSGSYCPEHFNFALPRPLHASPEPSPAVSESSSPAPSPSSSPFPNRNILLAPVPSPIEKTCCLLNCNQNGICDPTTCLCNCFTSFTGTACSDVILPRNLALIALSNNNNNNKQQTENLIELDSGEFEDNNNNNEGRNDSDNNNINNNPQSDDGSQKTSDEEKEDTPEVLAKKLHSLAKTVYGVRSGAKNFEFDYSVGVIVYAILNGLSTSYDEISVLKTRAERKSVGLEMKQLVQFLKHTFSVSTPQFCSPPAEEKVAQNNTESAENKNEENNNSQQQ
eukprot:c15333_g1_i1.p1 GENE.c15333_g1_i1~~c15333_g1_i1.p1  ORF type:complete len:775 (+),score=343.59 c15333_g1_i1:49-2373(+)